MIALLLTVALAGKPALSAEMEVNRNKVHRDVAAVLESVTAFQSFVTSRFSDYHQEPKTGIIITSLHEVGTDGLHAVMVIGVYRLSPGYEAGVRPGDRILRIDDRRLEHETRVVVYSLMDDKSGSVNLALKRENQVLGVNVQRRPLQCLASAAAGLDTSPWLKMLSTLHALATIAEEQLRLPEFMKLQPDERQPALDATKSAVSSITAAFPRLRETVGSELYKAGVQSCQAEFAQ